MKYILLCFLVSLTTHANEPRTNSGSSRARELALKKYVAINIFSIPDGHLFSTKLAASEVFGIGGSLFSAPNEHITITNPMILLENGKWAFLPKAFSIQICEQLRLGAHVDVLDESKSIADRSLFSFKYKVADFNGNKMVETEQFDYLSSLSCENIHGRRFN